MEHCNREEAIIAKKMALEKMEKKDYMGARKYAKIAQKLCSDLENIVQMILVCDVHCYADEKVCGNEMDWYKILQIEKKADGASIKRQYNRLALSLHPDKNRFPGAADAFQLIREAKTVLLDSEKRRWYDGMCRAEVLWGYGSSGVQKRDEVKGTSFEGSKRGRRQRVFEGSRKERKKRKGSKKDNVVERGGDDTDDVVEIESGVQKLKSSGSIDVSAQEVDKRGKKRAKFASKMQDNGRTVEDNADDMDHDVEIDGGVKKSKNRSSFDDSAQEVDKSEETGKRVENDGDNMDDEVEIVGKVEKSKHSTFFDVSAQEVDKQGKRAVRFATKTEENGKSCGDKSLPNARPSQLPAYLASEIAFDAKILEYSAAEFYDFDTKRAKRCFGAGQIWAAYDTLDAMPRFYALITKVISKDFKLQITWLEPYPHNATEREWLCRGLPTSCGKFKLGHTETIDDHTIFSHLVTWRKHVNLPNIYEVHPRKGETWALFKNWDLKWYQKPETHKVYEFEVVEILSDYDSNIGVSVTFLRKIEGFTSVFCREKEEVDFEVIPVKDGFRLSHRVPSVEMKCKEGLNGIKRCFELDPASLPHDLISH